MTEMNEQRSSAEIVAEWRAELEIHDREAQDGDRTWHFTHYIRADPEMFIRAALRALADADLRQPGSFHTLPRFTRKVRDSLVTQGYVEMQIGRDSTAYRITPAGRKAAL